MIVSNEGDENDNKENKDNTNHIRMLSIDHSNMRILCERLL